MKQTLQRHLLTLLSLLLATPLFAYDFEADGIYYNVLDPDAKTVEVASVPYGMDKYSGDIIIPETVGYDGNPYTVTSIGEDAFYECTSLTGVEIPGSVTSIGDFAFKDCTSLTGVEIPGSVTLIGDYVFSGCSSLINIVVANDNNYYMSEYGVLFTNEDKVLVCYPAGKIEKEYIIPSFVTSIGKYAFEYCTSLTAIKIPESVTSIERNAFEYCTSLTEVEIPGSVTSIGIFAFMDCTSLTAVKIPVSMTSIEEGMFYLCSSLTKVEIPWTVTSIGVEAFRKCTSLTEVEIPSSVTSIGSGAFEGCTSLTAVRIPDSVTSIEYDAFYGCISLTVVEIPGSVTTIGIDAFSMCPSLESIYYNTDSPIECNPYFDEENYEKATLYIPTGSRAAFESAHPWSNFLNIVEIDFDDNMLNEKVLTSENSEVTLTADGMAVNTPAGVTVIVLTTDGRTVARYVSDGEPRRIAAVPGVYMVAVGKNVTKIMVR